MGIARRGWIRVGDEAAGIGGGGDGHCYERKQADPATSSSAATWRIINAGVFTIQLTGSTGTLQKSVSIDILVTEAAGRW